MGAAVIGADILAELSPVNVVLPAISGSTIQGQTITTTNGTWAGVISSYSYQWYSAGVLIGGAALSTYVTQISDVGNTITCKVTASNVVGSTSATSASFGLIVSISAHLMMFSQGMFKAKLFQPHEFFGGGD